MLADVTARFVDRLEGRSNVTDIVEGYPIQLPRYRAKRGDALRVELPIVTASGTKVDLSGYGSTWSAQLRASEASAIAVDFAVDSSLVDDADDPHLILSLTGEQTAGMAQMTYGYEVQASGGAQSPFTVWQGSFVMSGEFTR